MQYVSVTAHFGTADSLVVLDHLGICIMLLVSAVASATSLAQVTRACRAASWVCFW